MKSGWKTSEFWVAVITPVVLAVWPGVKFNEKGQNVSAEHPVVQVQNGEYAVVWPPLAELMYPAPSWQDR